MQRIRTSFYLLACLLALCSGASAQAEITVEASLSHLSFPVDQGTMLTITVNGASRIANIEVPEIEGVTLHNRGQSSRINIINGSMSSSLANNYLVQAQKPGVYTIPPIKVHVGSETVTTKPLSFEATAGSPGSGGGTAEPTSEEIAFIRVSSLADHYPGEIVPLRIKAYFSQKYRVDINSLPALLGDGVVMAQLGEKPTQTQERVKGIPYNVLIWDTTLSGIKVGKHPLSFRMDASLLVSQRRRSASPFGGGLFDDPAFNDPFFDSFFGGAQRKPIELTSAETIFNVIPLPTANQPKDFTGAIGSFTIKTAANRQELEVGEPLKLTIEIAGSGNFDRVEAPVFPDDPNWKTYAPTGDFTSQGNSYTGVKVFDQAVIAKTEAVREIPALSFSYFNPAKKEYVTVASAPIAVKITKTIAGPNPVVVPQNSPAPAPSRTQDNDPNGSFAHMAPLNLQLGSFQNRIVPLFLETWFLGLTLLCLLILLILFFRQLHRAEQQKHPDRMRRKQKSLTLADDLQRVEQACQANDSRAFLSGARTAIQNQLGISWNMTATAISLADLRSRLGPDSPLVEIFAAADAAAYGGAGLSRERMEEYLQTMKKELEKLP